MGPFLRRRSFGKSSPNVMPVIPRHNAVIPQRVLVEETVSRLRVIKVWVRRIGDSFVFHALTILLGVIQAFCYILHLAPWHSHKFHASRGAAIIVDGLNKFFTAICIYEIVLYLILHVFLANVTSTVPIAPPDDIFYSKALSTFSGRISARMPNAGITQTSSTPPTAQVTDAKPFQPFDIEGIADCPQGAPSKPSRVPIHSVYGNLCEAVAEYFSGRFPAFLECVWQVCLLIFVSTRGTYGVPLALGRFFGYLLNPGRLPTSLRIAAAVNKRLFDTGPDVLDLTYITDRIIAMALPAEGLEAFWRTPAEMAAKFMRVRHGIQHSVINACSERFYNRAYFARTFLFPCKDHEVMPVYKLLEFCRLCEELLIKDTNSVVAVHCKGGKGRTGLLISCWLIYSKCCTTPMEALEMYGQRRTDDAICGKLKTVTNPCQVRYLCYLHDACIRPNPPLPLQRRLKVKQLVLLVPPRRDKEVSKHKYVLSVNGLFPPRKLAAGAATESWPWVSAWKRDHTATLSESKRTAQRTPEEGPLLTSLPPHVRFTSLTQGHVETYNEASVIHWTCSAENNIKAGALHEKTIGVQQALKKYCSSDSAHKNGALSNLCNSTLLKKDSAGLQKISGEAFAESIEVTEEFGFELYDVPASFEGGIDISETYLIGKIWLHAAHLHVALPPRDKLEQLWRPGAKCKPVKHYDSSLPYFVQLTDQKTLLVALQWPDIDFINKAMQRKYRSIKLFAEFAYF